MSRTIIHLMDRTDPYHIVSTCIHTGYMSLSYHRLSFNNVLLLKGYGCLTANIFSFQNEYLSITFSMKKTFILSLQTFDDVLLLEAVSILTIYFLFQVSSINRVLRNLVSTKEQHSAVHAHAAHMSAAAAHAAATDSSAGIYDKLRMFNGANAAAASWAW